MEHTMKSPHHYPKRILLAVSGMSPQILTETLYAIAVAEKVTPFVPTEVHLITTQEGARRAKLELLHAETGKFRQLCQDYERVTGFVTHTHQAKRHQQGLTPCK
jgi:CRISPR-associated protein (TIGR02584 family)